ncbi:hypothetical protein DPQ22_06000 [Candidatus Tokpelaia sp.]|nr:hypothetical protein DPQ22_06000 [Candidatus Tokpelaia sp.]
MRGLDTPLRINTLAAQIVDSLRRIEYCYILRDKSYNRNIIYPAQPYFDPLKAAVMQNRLGNIDEACWLVFLATHFGKHAKNGWSLAKKVYSGGNAGHLWDWQTISANPEVFHDWLLNNQAYLSGEKFSNHRKYESLNPNSNRGTAEVFRTYVDWVQSLGGWQAFLARNHNKNPRELFRYLYQDMRKVMGFGRLGRFDYLTMLGKLGIIPIEPDSAYLQGATGPLKGARLLFDNNRDSSRSAKDLDSDLLELDKYLNVGMQVSEDSLCNWQKNSDYYQRFSG